jgi:hypothetical protein
MVGRSKSPQSRPRCLRAWSVGALIALIALVLAGCGGSGSVNSASATRSPGLETAAARERARHERERPAEQEKKARAEAIVKRIGPCESVEQAVASMTSAISAATKPGAGTTAYEQASSDVEALRGKLAELASLTSTERRAKLEESRRFLLKVGTIAEALKTNDLSLAQRELSGYRTGMVELSEHVKTAC